jgi:hypothetical protein
MSNTSHDLNKNTFRKKNKPSQKKRRSKLNKKLKELEQIRIANQEKIRYERRKRRRQRIQERKKSIKIHSTVVRKLEKDNSDLRYALNLATSRIHDLEKRLEIKQTVIVMPKKSPEQCKDLLFKWIFKETIPDNLKRVLILDKNTGRFRFNLEKYPCDGSCSFNLSFFFNWAVRLFKKRYRRWHLERYAPCLFHSLGGEAFPDSQLKSSSIKDVEKMLRNLYETGMFALYSSSAAQESSAGRSNIGMGISGFSRLDSTNIGTRSSNVAVDICVDITRKPTEPFVPKRDPSLLSLVVKKVPSDKKASVVEGVPSMEVPPPFIFKKSYHVHRPIVFAKFNAVKFSSGVAVRVNLPEIPKEIDDDVEFRSDYYKTMKQDQFFIKIGALYDLNSRLVTKFSLEDFNVTWIRKHGRLPKGI